MNDLSRESRVLLAEARQRDGISAADKDRIRNKLARRLGAGLALGSAVTASATVAEAARTTVLATVATWLPGAAKVIGIVAIAGGVTVGTVRVAQHRAHPAAAVVDASRANAVAVNAPHTNTAAPTEISKPGVEPLQDQPAPQLDNAGAAGEPAPANVRDLAVAKREAHGLSAFAAAPDPAPAASAKVDDSLSGQVAAIREARAAIRRGDGTAALAALDKGLPQGQAGPLEQEATLARVSALCLLGDAAAARRTADQFLVRFPDSLLAPRIRSSCAFATSP